MKKIEGTDKLYQDIITIVFEAGYCLHKEDVEDLTEMVCYELIQTLEFDEPIDFDGIVSMARDYGYKEGYIKVLVENPTNGKMYVYNNYGDNTWHDRGDLVGYA